MSRSTNSSLASAGQPAYSARQRAFRPQPHGERLGEVLRRVALRVPVLEMQHVVPAARPSRVVPGVQRRRGAEDLSPVVAAAQPERSVDRVTELVPQEAQSPPPIAAFDFAHHVALETHEARMPEEERHGDARHAVRRKPLGRKPEVRFEANAALLELGDEPLRVGADRAVRDPEAQVAEAQAQQRVVVEAVPSDRTGGACARERSSDRAGDGSRRKYAADGRPLEWPTWMIERAC